MLLCLTSGCGHLRESRVEASRQPSYGVRFKRLQRAGGGTPRAVHANPDPQPAFAVLRGDLGLGVPEQVGVLTEDVEPGALAEDGQGLLDLGLFDRHRPTCTFWKRPGTVP
jgi:hypothetical protein